jgi:general nucleoside transport system permease protein
MKAVAVEQASATAPVIGGTGRGTRLGRLNLEVRQSLPRWKHALFIALSLAVGLGISVILLAVSGVDVSSIYEEFILLTFFDRSGLSSVLIQASPLILVGLSAAVAFRVQFWNIGIEGQFFWGVIGATFVAINDIGPESLRIVLMFAAALLCGFAWTVVPSLLKLRLGVNEIITTLLLSYIAYLFVMNLVYGAWRDPTDFYPHSEPYDDPSERLPLIGWEKVHAGLVLALVCAAVVWWLMERSRFGRYMRFVGSNPRMALAVGVPVGTVTFIAVSLSGALSGAAGFVMATAQEFRLTPTMAGGYGFSGVVIAFLARNNPLAVVVTAFLLGGLYVAGQNIKVFYDLPAATVGLIEAIIVMSVAGSDFLVRHRLRWVR